jgi:hypothetical protein
MQSSLETTDIFRGAFFLSKGGRLSRVNVTENRRRVVSFLIVGEDLTELDEAYRDGKAMVNPLQLRESLNHLRDVLFRALRENERNNERKNGHEHIQRPDRRCKALS